MIVARGWTRPTVLAPVTVGRLFHGRKAVQDPCAQILPFLLAGQVSGQKQQRRVLRIVIGRGPDIGRVVPREIHTLDGVVVHQRRVPQYVAPPARSALVAQLMIEQAVSFKPHIRVPVAVEARFIDAIFVRGRQQIANLDGQSQHPGIVIMRVRGMPFCVQNRGSQNSVGKMTPLRPRFQLRKVGHGLGDQCSVDLCSSGFHQAKVSARQRLRKRDSFHCPSRNRG